MAGDHSTHGAAGRTAQILKPPSTYRLKDISGFVASALTHRRLSCAFSPRKRGSHDAGLRERECKVDTGGATPAGGVAGMSDPRSVNVWPPCDESVPLPAR